MIQNGDRWRVTAVQDEKLAKMIAQGMMDKLITGGGNIQETLQGQLKNHQNLGQ